MSRAGRFQPRLLPTLFSLGAALLCAALGIWQLQRLEWKRGLIAQREVALAAPPVAAPRTLAEAQPLEFHPVFAAGEFLNDKETLVHAIGPKGGAGFDVLTPLREPDGHTVMVNRGYVPTDQRDRISRPAGGVRIAGLLRVPPVERPGLFIPENHPQTGEWYWIDLPAIIAADHLTQAPPFYIDADATPNPGGWPQGRAAPPALPNDHLQYAITWFCLAVAAVVIYVLSQRRPVDPSQDPE